MDLLIEPAREFRVNRPRGNVASAGLIGKSDDDDDGTARPRARPLWNAFGTPFGVFWLFWVVVGGLLGGRWG